MSTGQCKRLIWLSTALVALCGVAVVAAAVRLPVEIEVPAIAETHEAADDSMDDGSKPTETSEPEVTLAELQQLCAIDLRGPLFDPPKTETADVSPTQTPWVPMTAQLVGTITEAGHSMALFRRNDGSLVLCMQGQSFDDAGGPVTVTRVEHRKATVNCGGRSVELVIPDPDEGVSQ